MGITAHCKTCGSEIVGEWVVPDACPECGGVVDLEVVLEPRRFTSDIRILLVDDDLQIRDSTRSLLELEGFPFISEASNGPEAVSVAEEVRPHVGLLDYMIPGLKGDDIAKLLRRLDPKAVIVAFSAVLLEPPDWADAYVDKSRLPELGSIVRGLTGAVAPSSPAAADG